MSNKIKAGKSAGVTTRKAINKGTGVALSGAQTVVTAIGGFFAGLIAGEPEVKAPRAKTVKPQAKTVAKPKTAVKKPASTKSN